MLPGQRGNLQATVMELGGYCGYGLRGWRRLFVPAVRGGGYDFPIQSFSASFWHYAQQQRKSRGVKVGIDYTLVPTEPFPVQLRQAGRIFEFNQKIFRSSGTLLEATLC
ncbi:hypothetical protein M378DRAFT_354608 [Amanita muscaria Koide BX008]|uniref:Uncharacterized protein n=1 Tax=Amanita muscaria (strain Koide BX008) TaxID=946122 RepID=A0A0C2WYI9_AMAMK|nr:hypothetical protein M378DRAFT_354608 [Amanita muscaria Koide BX008]